MSRWAWLRDVPPSSWICFAITVGVAGFVFMSSPHPSLSTEEVLTLKGMVVLFVLASVVVLRKDAAEVRLERPRKWDHD